MNQDPAQDPAMATTELAASPSDSTATPANANAGCVGPSAPTAGQASACEGCPNQAACSSGAYSSPQALAKAAAEQQELQDALRPISHVILVLSGKGGVGKSTVATQLALSLAAQGLAVGLLDVDLCGPSAPRMMLGTQATAQAIRQTASGAWIPVYVQPNLALMSIAFLLPQHNQAVIWRGPRKNALIQQFLTKVDWTGDTDGLDYLIVDTPPGTSDEHISIVQYLLQAKNGVAGALIVTTPEEVSLADVRKELNFCQKTGVRVLGVVENMSEWETPIDQLRFFTKKPFQQQQQDDGQEGDPILVDSTDAILETLRTHCPQVLDCVVRSPLFATRPTALSSTILTNGHVMSGAEQMALDYQVPFWGRLPMDPNLLQACDQGQSFVLTHPQATAARVLLEWCRRIQQVLPVEMA